MKKIKPATKAPQHKPWSHIPSNSGYRRMASALKTGRAAVTRI